MKIFNYTQKGYLVIASILLLIASFSSQKAWADRHDVGHRSGYHDRYYGGIYGRHYQGKAYYRLYRPYQYYYNDYRYSYYPYYPSPYYYYYYDNRPFYMHPFSSLFSLVTPPFYRDSYYHYPDDETIGFYTSKKNPLYHD